MKKHISQLFLFGFLSGCFVSPNVDDVFFSEFDQKINIIEDKNDEQDLSSGLPTGSKKEIECQYPTLDCDKDNLYCESLTSSVFTCGRCDNDCTNILNSNTVSIQCLNNSTCEYECYPGYKDADGDSKNGCEVKLGECPANNLKLHVTAYKLNEELECIVDTCDKYFVEGYLFKYDDCDKDPTNGCEIQLNTDNDCGACGEICTGSEHCYLVDKEDGLPLDVQPHHACFTENKGL